MHAEFAIIGGTGVYDPALLSESEQKDIETEYGMAQVTLGTYAGRGVVFMPRHGYGHAVPPHKINYRANIRALQMLGVTHVLATAAVGSLQKEYEPGKLVLIDDFIDMTKSRPATFFEGETGVVHIDMSDPYCGRFRQVVQETALEKSIDLIEGGTYVCTEGPRFETAAEIRAYVRMDGHVVGMTSVPEVVLAKEAQMCYSSVAIVTNYCTGISSQMLTHQEVVDEMAANVDRIRALFAAVIQKGSEARTCNCPETLKELGSL